MSPDQRIVVSAIIHTANVEIAERIGLPGTVYFQEHTGFKRISIAELEYLFSAMCACWGVRLETIKSPTRKKDIAVMRKILWYAASCIFPGAKQQLLATSLNRKCHTTIIHSLRVVQDYIETNDPIFMYHYEPVKHFFDAK